MVVVNSSQFNTYSVNLSSLSSPISGDNLLDATDDSKTEPSVDLDDRTEFTDVFKSVDDAFAANLK
jgi:hypothetical protein